MTPQEFRHELKQLYAYATRIGLISDDLAAAAKTNRHTIARWLGGYACPATSEDMLAVLEAVDSMLQHRATLQHRDARTASYENLARYMRTPDGQAEEAIERARSQQDRIRNLRTPIGEPCDN